MPTARLMLGDCLEKMAEIEDQSIDCIFTDPPYPCIARPYGRMTEAGWHAMMRGVVVHCRRILKPRGSAVFVLQPNSRKLGSMRLWLWEFVAWAGREWNLIQDAWWWNTAALPEAHAIQGRLMRPSLKACVWLGPPDCYRDQDAVLWSSAGANAVVERCARARNEGRRASPGGQGVDRVTVYEASRRRGGVTPFNVFPTTHGQGKSKDVAGAHGHGAGTPMLLCDWWVRYISPPDGVVCDPFMGSGTTGVAALRRGRSFIGIERDPDHFAVTEHRIAAVQAAMPLFPATA
jgi:16S rRNA G966 N2-methylase RsmD